MKRFIIVIIGIVLVSSLTVKAVDSNSSYRYQMDIGEQVSNINNNFTLDYQWQVVDYNLQTELNLNKGYRFLDGNMREQDWRTGNYLVAIAQGRDKFELGEVSPSSSSSFVRSDRLLGFNLDWSNYQLWSGYGIRGSGFSSTSKPQLGFSHQQQGRKIGYQVSETREDYNHYLSYNDYFTTEESSIQVDTALARSQFDNLTGIASNIGFSSQWHGLNYDLTLDYKSPEFETVTSSLNVGQGRYRTRLHTYRKLGPTLVTSRLSYSEDNLDRKAEKIIRDWKTNWKLNYYSQATTYSVKVDYNKENTYLTQDRSLTEQEDDIQLELGYEQGDFNSQLTYNHPFQTERSISYTLDYRSDNYEIDGSFNWERRENNWKKDYELNFAYDREVTSNLNYNLATSLQEGMQSKVDLKQELDYDISTNQNLSAKLNLSSYFNSATINKNLILNYHYRF